MGDEGPPESIIMRSDPRNTSLGSRLSFAVRRSLRLGPKKSTTYGLESKDDYDLEKLEPAEHDLLQVFFP